MNADNRRNTAAPRTLGWLLLVAIVVLAPRPGLAEYRLQPGDFLDVLVAGIPEFRHHVEVGSEGNIALPLAGRVPVGGLSAAEAQTRIAGELTNKLYRQFTADGREISHLILGNEVVVEIGEYSPIYVSGDVSKPGAYPFRPGITVRQAIAVAGGYNPVRAPGPDPMVQIAELQAQYNTLQVQYQGDLALAWRLRKELGQDDSKDADVPAGSGDVFQKGELQSLEARKATLQSVRAMLQAAIKQSSLQLDLLAEKKAKDEDGNRADIADFNSVRELFQKGLAPSTRLSDARRAALLSSEQLLQTIAQMNDVERQRNDYARQLQQLDNQARVDDLDKLQQTIRHMAELRATMKGVTEKLALLGHLRTDRAVKVQLAVFRRSANGSARVAAADDLALEPGDVVDVTLPNDATGSLEISAVPIH